VGHPKRPGIIDARITAEYVICGVCLTKNRIVSHQQALRPVCGRCGYPLPDPFEAQSGIRSLGEWMARYRYALAAITGLLLIGLFVWLASGKEERSTSLSGPRTQLPDAARINDREAPVSVVALVVRGEAATGTDDEQGDLLPGSRLSQNGSPSNGLYGPGTPTKENWMKSESVVIVIDVCAGRARERFQAGSGHDGDLPGVFVSSRLQQTQGDPLDLLASPHVVEQIHINTGLDLSN
jgi:hypothetical protein